MVFLYGYPLFLGCSKSFAWLVMDKILHFLGSFEGIIPYFLNGQDF